MLLANFFEQFDIDPAGFLALLASAGLLLFFFLSFLVAPLLGVATEGIAIARRKILHDKCALQIFQAAFFCGLFALAATALGTFFLLGQYQPEMLRPPLLWQPLAVFLPPLAALLLLLLLIAIREPLKKLRPLHLAFGLFTALFSLLLLCTGLLLISALLLAQDISLDAFFQVLVPDFLSSPVLWILLAYLVCMGMASGSGLAQLWFIIRRRKADYGRDYYVFAMRYCARFALVFTLLATACAGGVYWLLDRFTPRELSQAHDLGLMLIAWGLPLSCSLLWLGITKSDTPLRHKPGAFFACLFLLVALCAQLLLLANTFPPA
jgi:hypothetical protein